jgi:hypothetical protein
MSTLRHRYRLVLDGTKFEVVTSARDMAAAQIDPSNPNANFAEATFRLLHAACIRNNIPNIPSDWESFADLLDDVDDMEPGEDANLPDPTRSVGLETLQSK